MNYILYSTYKYYIYVYNSARICLRYGKKMRYKNPDRNFPPK